METWFRGKKAEEVDFSGGDFDASGQKFTPSGGGGSSEAADVSVVDVGGYFDSTDLEGVTQELGAAVGSQPTLDTDGTLAANSDTRVASQKATKTYADTKIPKTLADANSVLYAVSDDTPAALAMGASTILARLAAGNIVAATPAELRTLLALVVGTNVQAYDATLAALAAADWAANALPIGTGADTLAQTAFAANTFPARASTGNLVAKTITDAALDLLDDTTAAAMRTTLGIPAVVGGVEWTVVTKSADENVASSTSVQNDDHLFFTAVSGAFYEVDLSLLYVSAAGGGTPDLKLDVGEDSTARGAFTGGPAFSNADALGFSSQLAAQGNNYIFGTATTARAIRMFGNYIGGGGTFRLRWAQNTSDLNNTTMLAGSLLRYRRIV